MISWDGHETWYRVVGELDPGPLTPVVICHGGPGAAHDYAEPIADLSRFGRACVLYDQLGCGKSEHLPDAPADFWTAQLFKDELVDADAAPRHRRSVRGRRPVVGRHARDGVRARPSGGAARDRRRRLAGEHAAVGRGGEPAARDLPPDVQETLTPPRGRTGRPTDPEYEDAVRVFYDRHLCRVPWPDCVERTFAQMADDPTVYHTMNGPSEFHVHRLAEGRGTSPTGCTRSRRRRCSSPAATTRRRRSIVEQIHERIPGAQWRIFEESSHMPHVEEPEAFLERVEEFLQTID